MNQTKSKIFYDRKEHSYMEKEEIINFLYFLWDKIDPNYLNEVNSSIKKMISKLEGCDDFE